MLYIHIYMLLYWYYYIVIILLIPYTLSYCCYYIQYIILLIIIYTISIRLYTYSIQLSTALPIPVYIARSSYVYFSKSQIEKIPNVSPLKHLQGKSQEALPSLLPCDLTARRVNNTTKRGLTHGRQRASLSCDFKFRLCKFHRRTTRSSARVVERRDATTTVCNSISGSWARA